MLFEKFEIILCLLAGLVVLVLGLLFGMEFSAILIRLLIALFVFYIIGLIVKGYLRRKVFFKTDDEDEDADNNAQDEESLDAPAEAATDEENTA